MIIKDENVAELQAQMTEILPLLDDNLGRAYSEYMDGSIAKGAFRYVTQRHEVASIVANIDQLEVSDETTPVAVFKYAAPVMIDLRSAIADLSGDAKLEAEKKQAKLVELFFKNGFTASRTIFKIPVLPEMAVE